MEEDDGSERIFFFLDKMLFDYILRALWLHHALTITAIANGIRVFLFSFSFSQW